MASAPSRRSLFRAAALVAATPVISAIPVGRAAAASGASAAAVAVAAGLPAPSAWAVRPFELEDVKLGQGIFAGKRQLMLDHGRGYDVNRLLQVFRANAGLSTRRRGRPRRLGGTGRRGQRQPARPLHRSLPDHAVAGVRAAPATRRTPTRSAP